jgi:alpha-L-rhamnosidase
MSLTVVDLAAEHRGAPPFVATATPRLSWRVTTTTPNWRQASYQIEVAGDLAYRGDAVTSGDSVLVPWPAAPLASHQSVTCRVRVTGTDGAVSDWSEPLAIYAPLLDAAGWSARFVSPADASTATESEPCPYFRREFALGQPWRRAVLSVTALGVYQVQINGSRVGDEELAPGWTSYRNRLRFASHDVTSLLRDGNNAMGAIVGDGWARGRLGFSGARNMYSDRPALLAQLDITLADGSVRTVATDGEWHSGIGPERGSDLYDGETFDARLGLDGWAQPGYDADGWQPVEVIEHDLTLLTPAAVPPVRAIQEVAPVSIQRAPSGETLVDFGQNLVGRVRIRLTAEAGTTITIRHAEVLENGELGVRPLRSAQATDRYIARGGGPEEWEPRFTFHGFRYAGVSGWPGELRPDDITAVVLHSDMVRTGWFECSDASVNQLYQNIVWGMRGNFLDVPTDCPQRDERLGWTGDIQVFAATATLLYDTAALLNSWLQDLAAEQEPNGNVPFVIPSILPMSFTAAGWGDAATVVPMTLTERYGDLEVLRRQYPSMKAWVEHVKEICDERRVWGDGFQFGDWVDPKSPPDAPGDAQTDSSLVGTAWFARSAQILAQAAELLGEQGDAAAYRALAAEVAAGFRTEFVAPNGRVVNDSQTAHLLALAFSLVTPEQRPATAARLRKLIEKEGHRLSTGFLGTPWLCEVLTRIGEDDMAYRLLLQTDLPSWLYPITMGATTIWERWDAMLPDGSINPGEMTSFNHYAYGAVGAWLYERMAGLRQHDTDRGWRRFVVEPHPGGGMQYAKAAVDTPYGRAESSWRIDHHDGAPSTFTLRAVVPANTTAELWLPGATEAVEAGSGSHELSIELSDAQRRRYLPSRDGARLHLDSPLAEVVADPEARQILVRRRALGVLVRIVGDKIPDMSLRDAMQSSRHPTTDKQLDDIEQDLIRL